MKRRTVLYSLLLFFLCGLPGLLAQDMYEAESEIFPESAADEMPGVALVPFWGENKALIAQLGELLYLLLENEGLYRPEAVDMVNLPEDVPEGGFPPYVCPSPSLTKTAPYAVTGELVFDDESSLYHLRLYLWEMAGTRLVFTDESTGRDRGEFEMYLPSLLEWLFSWLEQPREMAGEWYEYSDPLAQSESGSSLPEEKWLYLGLRVGPSVRLYSRDTAEPFAENNIYSFLNITAGVQATFQFLPFLAVQAEFLFTNDYAPYSAVNPVINTNTNTGTMRAGPDPFSSYSLMFPLALRYTYRQGRLFAGALAGIYFSLPLGDMENKTFGGNFGYSMNPPLGYTVGINVGTKLGPGSLFLDLRWAADIGETQKNSGEDIYKRSMVTIAIGYELGFFTKKK
ncbi:MAG: PorT family protein [Treponema sp.]|nr:PorT family protein [Treponema sp.]